MRVKSRPSKKRLTMQKSVVVEPKGLCVTCNHIATCSFRRDPGQPVIFCDEFDSYAPSFTEEAVTESAPSIQDLNEWDQYKGLCVNCEHRKNCAIRDKEIGVWHCEEYI